MQIKKPKQKQLHIPVLLNEVLSTLKPKNGETYLDLTAGYGGHASTILQKTEFAPSVLVDRDIAAQNTLQAMFVDKNVNFLHKNFYDASIELLQQEKKFDLILADLGVSSPHLDESNRGFSIVLDGPLDMRMDTSQSLTADTIVNSYSTDDIADILRVYGEEPKASSIAKRIVSSRPIKTTHQLATIVAQAWPGYSRTHPATRTFQALRIAVNDELRLLEISLPLWEQLLAPEGRLAVITFHSLEDRIVKNYFKDHSDSYDASLVTLTSKPVVGKQDEIVINPRARSAKLRAVAKIKI